MRQVTCSTTADIRWNPNERCHCSLKCDNVQREGICADGVCCEFLDWFQQDQNLPDDGFGAPPAPCFPFCGVGWYPSNVSRRCCGNCDAPSAASTTGTSPPTSGTSRPGPRIYIEPDGCAGGNDENNNGCKDKTYNMATHCNGVVLLLVVPLMSLYLL